jgi:drug/metabolite transporter (DMT)-like permease
MHIRRLAALTALTMCAFAANSVLCRLALRDTDIDAATFTLVRLASGAAAMVLILGSRRRAASGRAPSGDWRSAIALFAYAAAFSVAYEALSTGTGALLLFGAVQLTMIGYGLAQGERFTPRRTLGAVLAASGLVVLVAPGLAAPPAWAAGSMALAGVAWGVYSIRGRESSDPLADTAGNFIRAAPLSLVLVGFLAPGLRLDLGGVALAVASGAVASGVGYAIWYAVLPHMRATSAALVQLSVPVIAAAAGAVLLAEGVTPRLLVATATVLGGIALALVSRRADVRSVPPVD